MGQALHGTWCRAVNKNTPRDKAATTLRALGRANEIREFMI